MAKLIIVIFVTYFDIAIYIYYKQKMKMRDCLLCYSIIIIIIMATKNSGREPVRGSLV